MGWRRGWVWLLGKDAKTHGESDRNESPTIPILFKEKNLPVKVPIIKPSFQTYRTWYERGCSWHTIKTIFWSFKRTGCEPETPVGALYREGEDISGGWPKKQMSVYVVKRKDKNIFSGHLHHSIVGDLWINHFDKCKAFIMTHSFNIFKIFSKYWLNISLFLTQTPNFFIRLGQKWHFWFFFDVRKLQSQFISTCMKKMASQFFKNVPVVCHRKKNYVFHNVFVIITIISEKKG